MPSLLMPVRKWTGRMETTLLKAVVGGAVCVLAFVAGYYDWRWRRIPNWLTYPAAALALLMRGLLGGAVMALDGAGGMAFAFALMALLYAGGMMGGGDVKLAAAMAAWVGLAALPRSLFFMAVLGAMLSLFMAAQRGMGKQRWTGENRLGAATGQNTRLTVPYGVAIGGGALLAMVW